MIWSHNDLWMLTADHSGFVKYWQSNMNNVKMYQAHRDPVRGLRWDMLHGTAASAVCLSGDFSAATLDIQACFLVLCRLMTVQRLRRYAANSGIDVMLVTMMFVIMFVCLFDVDGDLYRFQCLVIDNC